MIAKILFSACWNLLWWIKTNLVWRWQMQWLQEYYFMYVGTLCDASKRIVCIFQTILKKLLSSWRDCWGDHWQQSWREYWNKFLNIYFLYLQDPDNLNFNIIMERLTTIFGIRMEKKVNIYEFIKGPEGPLSERKGPRAPWYLRHLAKSAFFGPTFDVWQQMVHTTGL